MKFYKQLGLELFNDSDTHKRAMRRTDGDPNWVEAMYVLGEYSRESAHRAAVAGSNVTELFPTEPSLSAENKPQLPPKFANVRLILPHEVQVVTTAVYDQDSEAI